MKPEINRKSCPPHWAEKFLTWFCAPHLKDEIVGDVLEEFDYNVRRFGLHRARRKYVLTVLGFLKAFAIRRRTKKENNYGRDTFQLWGHYLTFSFRTLSRHKLLSAINIGGLSLGLACCLLISLYTKDELSFDSFHSNIDQIYQLTCTRVEKDKKDEKFASAAMIQGPSFAAEIPELEGFVRVKPEQVVVRSGNGLIRENIQWVDSSFFNIFSFTLLSGNPAKVLNDLHSLVLTEKTAVRYFNSTDAVGRVLYIQVDGHFEPFTVSGLCKDVPENSTIKFDMLLPFAYQAEMSPDYGWHWVSYPTYFKIRPDADRISVLRKMDAVYQTQAKTEIDEMKSMGYDNRTHWGLEPFQKMHLTTEYLGVAQHSNPMYSYVLTGIALFILLIACINFVTLSIARALRRSREIGVRKVIGGQRSQLIRQFLGESLCMVFIAFLLALTLAQLAMPVFNQLSGKQLSLEYLLNATTVLEIIALYFLIGTATGFYPALVLSGFNPAKALNGTLQHSGKDSLSRKLVVAQFSVTAFLIIATMFLHAQLSFLTEKDLGYDDKNLLEITVNEAIQNTSVSTMLKSEFMQIPGVETVASKNVGHFGGATRAGEIEINATYVHTDEDLVPALHLKIEQGRNFSKDFPADSLNSVLINETFAKAAGWPDPLGHTIDHMSIPGWGDRKVFVVGVVRDFHSESLREKIVPTLFTYETKLPLGKFLIHISPTNVPQTVHAIEKVFLKSFPYNFFQYSFKDDLNKNYYQSEKRWKEIITIAAAIAIFISCTGLFGLTALNTQKRTKEIGIRKVMGATVTAIVGLIFGDILRLILIAMMIATPLGLYALDIWLNTFAYRIAITPGIFIIAGALTTLIALITVASVAMKAALANPAKSLKTD